MTTIPHQYSQHKWSGFPVGSCDTAAADGLHTGNGLTSGCGSLGVASHAWVVCLTLSVENTGARKEAAQKERLLRGADTRQRRKADLA